MKALVWVVFVILVAFWTGLVALTEQLSQWLLASMATGQVGELAAIPDQWPVPAWLGLWVDTEWLKSMQEAGLGLVQWLTQVMPSADGLMRWISPLLWLCWGLGTIFLWVCAAAAHWLLGKRLTPGRQSDGL
ncbi:hypothetical protein [Limnohabitans sp.]|jgi:hypothetical protein|uniref:hypothetical protein n=1 Tax=Limnohabitans sp. TaxID=1907725 RepID=UPI0037BFF4BE